MHGFRPFAAGRARENVFHNHTIFFATAGKCFSQTKRKKGETCFHNLTTKIVGKNAFTI